MKILELLVVSSSFSLITLRTPHSIASRVKFIMMMVFVLYQIPELAIQ